MKRTPLKRYKRINPRRPTPRNRKTVVRLTGVMLKLLRLHCYREAQACCQECGKRLWWNARFDGDPDAYDMAHIVSRGAGGSDTLDNVRALCHQCHMREHQEGKAA